MKISKYLSTLIVAVTMFITLIPLNAQEARSGGRSAKDRGKGRGFSGTGQAGYRKPEAPEVSAAERAILENDKRIITAAATRNLSEFNKLLSASAAVNKRDEHGNSALYYLAWGAAAATTPETKKRYLALIERVISMNGLIEDLEGFEDKEIQDIYKKFGSGEAQG